MLRWLFLREFFMSRVVHNSHFFAARLLRLIPKMTTNTSSKNLLFSISSSTTNLTNGRSASSPQLPTSSSARPRSLLPQILPYAHVLPYLLSSPRPLYSSLSKITFPTPLPMFSSSLSQAEATRMPTNFQPGSSTIAFRRPLSSARRHSRR